MGKSYTMPFYSGIKEGGVVIINSDCPSPGEEDIQRLKDLNVAVFYIDGTQIALEVAGTELSTNMTMIGSVAGITKCVSLECSRPGVFRSGSERNLSHPVEPPHWMKRSRRSLRRRKCSCERILRLSSAPMKSRAEWADKNNVELQVAAMAAA